MPIATINFDPSDESVDWNQTDIHGLQEAVMIALDRHFSTYEKAAEAQQDHSQVLADIDADSTMTLFGSVEARRAGLMAHPKAFEWSAFEAEAAAQVAPFCFSIRFTY